MYSRHGTGGRPMTIYLPRVIVPMTVTDSQEHPLYFFAGPVRGGGDWQAQMAPKLFDADPKAHIAIPTRWRANHPLANFFYRPFGPGRNRQLVWERYYLQLAGRKKNFAGCVLFWLGLESETDPHPGPEPYGMDTRREIGKFTAYAELGKVRMVIGGHPDFFGLEIIMYELNKAFGNHVPFYEDMDEMVAAAKFVARR